MAATTCVWQDEFVDAAPFTERPVGLLAGSGSSDEPG
jgi:hypothetical protein